MRKNWFGAIAAAAAAIWLFAGPAPAMEALVDLNSASEQELIELPGIGPAKAKAIVEYRADNPFRSIEDLQNVSGIGGATLDGLKDQVTVGAADTR